MMPATNIMNAVMQIANSMTAPPDSQRPNDDHRAVFARSLQERAPHPDPIEYFDNFASHLRTQPVYTGGKYGRVSSAARSVAAQPSSPPLPPLPAVVR